MLHVAAAFAAGASLHAPAIRAQPARPARLSRPALAARRPTRRTLAPVAVLDPSTAAMWTYQAQEFGLTMMGIGAVSCLASGAAHAMRRATAAYTAAKVQESVSAPVAQAASAFAAAAPVAAAAALEQQQPAALELGDLKSELQQAADAAVAGVKSAAAAPAAAAKAAAAAPAPNGSAVKPGLTVEEATQQVKDWIAAWHSSDEGEPTEAVTGAGAASGAPTTRVTEPSMPSSAAAVLSQMTADAPVASTPVGIDVGAGAGTPAAPVEEEQELAAVGAAVSVPTSEPEGPSAAEREAEYKARISSVMSESRLAYSEQLGREQARVARVTDRMRNRVVQVGADYQAKIESLWQLYESKKVQEEELLQKSQRILDTLAQQEALERQQLAEAVAVQASAQPGAEREEEPVMVSIFARIAAFFQAVFRWVQQLLAGLTGGNGSAAGASA